MNLIWLFLLGGTSFLVTFAAMPTWIKRAFESGFTGKDVHKREREVAELGGIVVILGTVVALLVYIALETFYFRGESLIFFLAAMATILIAALIGMTDDILGWRIGLSQREKVLLTFFVPAPMVVINAGTSTMKFPILGGVELGLLYPFIIVPLGIIGATNGFNMLAGYNGLEAGLGVIILSALGFMALQVDAVPAVVIAVCFVGALLAFLYFNKYPSKIFPGDTLTYPLGAGIATVAILANIERFAAMLFFLYYLEFILKARGRFNPVWEASIQDDGSLAVSKGWYTLPHVSITILRRLKGSAREYEAVSLILAFQLLVAVVTVYVYSI